MKIIADTHTHTLMSGHAHSTVAEHIAEAKAKGLRFVAITDHTGIMPGSPNDVYFSTLCNTLPEEYNGVYLLRGCEVNIIDDKGTVDLPTNVLRKLDWVIASIHSFVTSPMDFQQCTRLWTAIAENPHIDVIGHCGEESYKFDYENVIPLFAKYGKIVEINASSFRSRPTCKENCIAVAKLCVKHGVPLVVSSDAHFAGNVGEVSVAVELLEKHGIPEESVLNADEKRFAAKISEITGRAFDVFG